MSKSLSILGYVLARAGRVATRAPWLQALVFTTVVVCTIVAGAVTLGFLNVDRVTGAPQAWRGPIAVELATPERTAGLARELQRLPEIERVEVGVFDGSRGRGLDAGLASGLVVTVQAGAEPLFTDRLVERLATRPEVAAVRSWTGEADTRELHSVSLGIALFAVMAALLVIWSIVRLAVLSRREELHVLTLLGATPRYIRAPHVLVAFCSGLIAAGVAVVLLYVAFTVFSPELRVLADRLIPGLTPSFFGERELMAAVLGVGVVAALAARSAIKHELRP